MTSGCLN